MKTRNIALFGLGALAAFGLASCDNIEESLAQPITNPQEAILSAEDLAFAANVTSIDLSKDLTADEAIPLFKVTKLENAPEGYKVAAKVDFSKTEDFKEYFETDATVDGDIVYVDAATLGEAWRKAYGKDPSEVGAYARVAAFLTDGSTTVRVGGLDTYYSPSAFNLTPFPADFDIEYAYYIVDSEGHAIKMDHSDKSPYDDPKFTAVISVSSLPYSWKVATEATKGLGINSDKLYGVGTPTLEKGQLFVGGKAVEVSTTGDLVIEVNMEAFDYNYKAGSPCLYIPGGGNGWSFTQRIGTEDYKDYRGFGVLDGEFKFTGQNDWNPSNWGAGGKTEIDGDTQKGDLAMGAGNINCQLGKGLYYFDVNLPKLEYSITKISSVGICGSINGWNQKEPIELKPNADLTIWSAVVEFKDPEDEFKFVFNRSWDINLGAVEGDFNNLWFGADNLPEPGVGKYLITIDFTTLPISTKATKQ